MQQVESFPIVTFLFLIGKNNQALCELGPRTSLDSFTKSGIQLPSPVLFVLQTEEGARGRTSFSTQSTKKDKMKSVEWLAAVLVSLVCILCVSKCTGFSVESHRLAPVEEKWLLGQKLLAAPEREPRRVDSGTNSRRKRGCSGFPCMFTHMGGSAGKASIRKEKLSMLRECIADPNCFSIGKRARPSGGYGYLTAGTTTIDSYCFSRRSVTSARECPIFWL